jgi:hypothetical protein
MTELSRREFTLQSALAALAGVTITVTGGCGGGSPSQPSQNSGDRPGVVENNHGHSATVVAARLAAGAAFALDIQGGADHPHTVAIDATELALIANGAQVVKSSSTMNGGTFGTHLHVVIFNDTADGRPGY